jgi:hypothetical protein
MSVKIEVLKYGYKSNLELNTAYSFGGLPSWSNQYLTADWTVDSPITVTGGDSSNGITFSTDPATSTITDMVRTEFDLVDGQTYTFEWEIDGLVNASSNNYLIKVTGDNTGGGGGDPLYNPVIVNNLSSTTYSKTFTFNKALNNNSNNMAFMILMLYGNAANDNQAMSISMKNFSINNSFVDSQYYPLSQARSIYGELDITEHSEFPLALTFQVSDIKDFTATSGNYSKTFKIPATKNNNKLLKNPYIVNTENQVDVYENIPCRIFVNDLYSLEGIMKVTGVGANGESPSYYDCIFYGNNLTWASFLQNKLLKDINWGSTGVGLTYNKSSITATWQHADSDDASSASAAPIVYPIVSYGDFNPEGEPQTIQLLDTYYDAGGSGAVSSNVGYYGWNNRVGSSTYGENPYGTPPPTPDWRPAIFVKDTLEKIFTQAGTDDLGGYTIDSDFMNTAMFKELIWVLPNFKYNNPHEREITYSYRNVFTNNAYLGYNDYTINMAAPDWRYFQTQLDFNNATAVSNSSYSLDTYYDGTISGGIFTAGEYGRYKIFLSNMSVWWELITNNMGSGDSIEFGGCWLEVQVQTVGHDSFNNVAEGNAGASGNISLSGPTLGYHGVINYAPISHNLWLNKGDRVRIVSKGRFNYVGVATNVMRFHDFGSNDPTSNSTSSIPNGQYAINFYPEYVEYGQTYDLDKVINPEYTQIDFIKGLSHAFNLEMTTDEQTKVIKIEPYDTFYKPYGEAIDWTDKLDRISQVKDKKLDNELNRRVIFKYKSDSSDKNVEARGNALFDGIHDEFPYDENLSSAFPKGESVFENPFFSGTYTAISDQDTVLANSEGLINNPPSACLWSENVSYRDLGRPVSGYNFAPRLLSWNKYSPSGVTVYTRYAGVQTWDTTLKGVHANNDLSSAYLLSNIYPQAFSYNQEDTSKPNLCYGNMWGRDYIDADGTWDSSQSVLKGLYDTYYKLSIEQMKKNPIIRNCYIDLKVTDILKLDFTKLIYIDGVYWRIARVIDFQPNKNQPTQVELIQWIELGIFAAKEPRFSSNTSGGGGGGNGGIGVSSGQWQTSQDQNNEDFNA